MRHAGRIALLAFVLPAGMVGYSFFTHEVIIDLAWEDSIKPLLLTRYPASSPAELRIAQSYAYGGSIIQDLGYYPFGSELFSDLAHYVRTGDFVRSLISQSSDLNELAFAIGALSHFAADTSGHQGVNLSVALAFPTIEPAFGHEVTYEQDKKAHLRVEFGFDMYQVVKGRYAQQDYHEHIGFRVARPLLERAFLQTYGIPFRRVFKHPELAIGSYRFAISKMLPEITRAALLNRRDQLAERSDFAEKQFLFSISKAAYRQEWGSDYERPGIGSRILAFFLRRAPKNGALTALDFVNPTTQTEDYFVKSVDASLRRYREFLGSEQDGSLILRNFNFDTGRDVLPSDYGLADNAYAQLVVMLAGDSFSAVTPELKQNILSFYSRGEPRTTREPAKWQEITQALAQLRSIGDRRN